MGLLETVAPRPNTECCCGLERDTGRYITRVLRGPRGELAEPSMSRGPQKFSPNILVTTGLLSRLTRT
jgi:hypothetical protein